MAFPDAAPPAPANAGNGRRKSVEAGRLNVPDNKDTTADAQANKPLIDKFGKRHTLAIFDNWSPEILKALGIRRVKPESPPITNNPPKFRTARKPAAAAGRLAAMKG